jgi:preprotein translocase SecE subunit
MGTAIGIGVAGLTGAFWLWGQLETTRIKGLEPVYTQAAAAGVIALVTAIAAYIIVGLKPRPNEFLIAVDQEMKKVNWSSRREIIGSTWVVITITVALAAMLFGVDILFAAFFGAIDLLQTG